MKAKSPVPAPSPASHPTRAPRSAALIISTVLLATPMISNAQDNGNAQHLKSRLGEIKRYAHDDRDGDGWGDRWAGQFPAYTHDKEADPDGDGVSNFEEMLDGTDPGRANLKGVVYISPEELLRQAIEIQRARAAADARMAVRRQYLRHFAAVEVGQESRHGRGHTMVEMKSSRAAKFRQKVEQERPLKEARMARAREELRRKGMPEIIAGKDGTVQAFANEHDGHPVFYSTQNVVSAQTISASKINLPLASGGLGLNLTGTGTVVGHFDAADALFTHPELGILRILNKDTGSSTIPKLRQHPTHTAGTIIGLGNTGFEGAHGFAAGALLESWDFFGDIGELNGNYSNAISSDDIEVSNHSYGTAVGFEGTLEDGTPMWYGSLERISPSSSSASTFHSTYTTVSHDLDNFVESNIYPLPVFAAGNDRNDTPVVGNQFWIAAEFRLSVYVPPTNTTGPNWDPYAPPAGDGAATNGYYTLKPEASAKNVLTIGSCEDLPAGFAGSQSVAVSAFSSFGPTRSGHIKPDVLANGENLYSAWVDDNGDPDYFADSGTSMAAPSVTGAIALLIQHYRNQYGSAAKLWASTLKGLVIHTADDVDSDGNAATDPDGPDFKAGYGLVNAKKAAALINADGATGRHMLIKEALVRDGYDAESPITIFKVRAVGSQPLRVTICWSDIATISCPDILHSADPGYGLVAQQATAWVEHPAPSTAITRPWKKDTTTLQNLDLPATQSVMPDDSTFDTVQVIDIPAPVAGGTYTVNVASNFPYALYPASQWGAYVLPVSIFISGAEAEAPDFKITNHELVNAADRAYSLEWPSVVGEFYRVETSTDLVNWTRAKKPVSGDEVGDLAPAGDITTLEVQAEASNTRQFWRIKRLQPWEMAP
ncbi:MAG: S8 family serine peptidase [Verrucomicrobiaceae bacterium]|nr:S8 family serine peptidase [Verrucomicrobiaceae bacterium]